MHQIEMLENRRLLSASVHVAAKSKPVLPDVIGDYAGTGTETKPVAETGNLRLSITAESAKGVISGTAENVTEDRTGDFVGKVTSKGAIAFKVLSTTGKTSSSFKGTYSSAGDITGKFKAAGDKSRKPSSGTFSLAPLVGD